MNAVCRRRKELGTIAEATGATGLRPTWAVPARSRGLSFTLTTLDLVRYEVANVAVRAWRAPRTVAKLLAAIERIADDGGVIESTAALLEHAAQLAEQHTISVYDAAYAAAADQADRRLVSCDDRDLVSKPLAIHPARVHAS